MKQNKTLISLISTLFVLSLGVNIHFFMKMDMNGSDPMISTIALAHSAQKEIGCPCCDKNIADCACGMAPGMRDIVNQTTEELFQRDARDLTKEAILLEAGKEFGMDTIMNADLRQQLKAQLIASAPAERPQIAIQPENYDFGEVSVKDGVAEASFDLKNNGTQPLVIKSMTSSCGCTSAKIVYRGVEGPAFGMHEKPKWTTSIAPGDTAKLVVMYDPSVHPDFVGDATRTVTVMTNDPINSKGQVTVTLIQK